MRLLDGAGRQSLRFFVISRISTAWNLSPYTRLSAEIDPLEYERSDSLHVRVGLQERVTDDG